MTLRIILKKKYHNILDIKTFIRQNLYNRGAFKGVLLLYIHKTERKYFLYFYKAKGLIGSLQV